MSFKLLRDLEIKVTDLLLFIFPKKERLKGEREEGRKREGRRGGRKGEQSGREGEREGERNPNHQTASRVNPGKNSPRERDAY